LYTTADGIGPGFTNVQHMDMGDARLLVPARARAAAGWARAAAGWATARWRAGRRRGGGLGDGGGGDGGGGGGDGGGGGGLMPRSAHSLG